MTIVVCSGGFDPLHSGHIAQFAAAKQLGDKLVVAVNSDAWLERKKGRAFMPIHERSTIVGSLGMVDEVIVDYDDSDGSSINALLEVQRRYPDQRILFANGGDRTSGNIPEMTVPGIEFAFGVGGENKANSSSWILEQWRAPKTTRVWGEYSVLHEVGTHTKVKELTVSPGSTLSMQRHDERAEHWFIAEGTAEVYTINRSSDVEFMGVFRRHQSLHIPRGQWHQLCNPGNEPLRVIEIQYGNRCEEDDIERRAV
jgi:D-beta-D-heptose 7-phosphate kinase/D-beta-D-heptose 1-phosphate adenosyltransferase